MPYSKGDEPAASAETTTPDYQSMHLGRVAAAVRDLEHPSHIGPYAIVELIGEGGMGAVYKAEQHAPIRRTVAVKVIKLGMDTKQVIARFESERQTLALMDHPGVAKVLDAGATPAGRPYFVMEYVPGQPILGWCDERKLSIQQRLELFIAVCEAVEHAHRKGIIHRDLKNSNVLIADVDGRPLAKVIDFGVAKVVGDREAQQRATLVTEQGQFIGTPGYMSPEQVERAAADIDTRSDIYSLGVLLYELIAGVQPIPSELWSSGTYEQMLRTIREADAPRPSTRMGTLSGDVAANIAHRRGTSVSSLIRQLRGELEWIPLKAMRKDRDQRYRSAGELADDVRNYLTGRPLIAGPESRRYRMQKFVRRHKAGVAAAAAVAIALLAGIVGTTWQAIRATRAETRALEERDNARATLEFLANDVLAGATPENIPDVKVRNQIIAAMITPAAKRVGEAFRDRPLAEASVRAAIQSVLREIGRSDLALPHAEEALAIRRRVLGEDHPDTLASLNDRGRLLRSLGRMAEAADVYRLTLERRRRVLGEEHPDTITSINNYAGVLERLGRAEEALPLLEQALSLRRRLLGEEHPDTLTSLGNYAFTMSTLKRHEEAEPLYRKVLEVRRRVHGNDHPMTLISMNNLAYGLRVLNRAEEALTLYKEALAGYVRTLGEDHPATLTATNNYAVALSKLNRAAEAEPLYKSVLERRRRLLGEDHPDTLWSIRQYAEVLEALGRHEEAAPFRARLPATTQSTP